MSKLQELINELCPNGVEWKKLGECYDVYNGMTGVSQKWKAEGNCCFIDYLNTYKNLKIDVSLKPKATVKNLNQNIVKKGDILLTSASEVPDECAITAVVEDEIEQGVFLDDHLFGFHLKPEALVNSTFVNYYMLTPTFRKDVKKKVKGVTRFYVSPSDVGQIKIPIPPLPVQEEIVRILDSFTNLAAELQAELQARKEQYEFYRNKLLSFNNLGGGIQVEWKKMSEMLQKITKVNWNYTNSCYQYIDLSSVDRDKCCIVDTVVINSETAPSRAQQIVLQGDILFGTTRPTLRRICIVPPIYDGQICSTGFCVIRSNKDTIHTNYLYHIMNTQSFWDYVDRNQEGAGYPSISDKKVKDFEIPIPPLAEQKRIANILDSFETLTTDLSEGLPAEIAAVQEQYEYYRNKLLDFREIKSNSIS